MIIAPYGKGNVAWFVLAALLAIVVLAQISRWYAAQHRIAKGKPKAIIANPLPRNKVVLAVSVLLLLISRNISIWRASVAITPFI